MVDQFAAPPINTLVSIRPLAVSAPGRDATQAPSLLANLPGGTTLEGFVVNRDASNNPILRTALGDLQMQSDVFVKTGSQMVIRVDATSDTRARIVTIDGLPPQEYAALNTRGITQDTIMPTQLLQRAPGAAPGTAPAPSPGQPLQAMLLNTTPPGGGNPAFQPMAAGTMPLPVGLLKLQAGASLRVMLLQVDLPSTLAGPTPGALSIAAPAEPDARPNSMPGPANAPTASTSPSVAGNRAPVDAATMASPQATRIAMADAIPTRTDAIPLATERAAVVTQPGRPPVMMPGPAAAAPMPTRSSSPTTTPTTTTTSPAAPAPTGLPGIVIGHEADGGNIVQTQFGTLKLYTPLPLPVQSRLTLDAEPDTRPATPAPVAGTIPVPEDSEALSSLSRGWPHLGEALHALAQDPAFGREAFQPVPHLGAKLTSGLLFFMAAVKGGDLRQWLGGRAVDALERKMPELASKLKGDMVQLQQLFLNSPIDQWTGVMLPMLHGDQLEYARLYLRDEPQDHERPGGKGKEQRFIVEIELSHLGEIQFDGFVRPTAPRKQFDLMIRTARPLDAAIANEIRALFETSIAATGYLGYLGFQQGSQHFVRPLASARSAPPDPHTILA